MSEWHFTQGIVVWAESFNTLSSTYMESVSPSAETA